IACKKATIQTVNTNNTRDSLTYQPKVPGSKWTYRRTVGGIQNTTFTFLRLTTDTTAYGSAFQTFSSDDNPSGNSNQHIRQDGNKYYSILTGSTNKPQLLVLDADKNVNESWFGGTNGSDTYTYTMKQKIPVYVLDNFTFKNVLVVRLDRTGGPNTASGDTYYAQGVGQVKSTGTVTSGGITLQVDVKVLTVDLK
ncbi:MAG: hypothetical protein LH615_00540, partial [Ferruginibacter sp.]|nr:hypothetical protein [Ferruginibacter sp.]